jgi:DNA polymerase alpha subunit B
MDSIVAMKASIQRQLAKDSSKKALRAMHSGSAAVVNRSRIPPNMARVMNTGAQVGVIQVKEEQNGAGPSKVVFKGPNVGASSRKDRACEFRYLHFSFSLA